MQGGIAMRRTFWFVVCLLIGSGWLLARGLAPTGKAAHPPTAAHQQQRS
jgi:hypothetical protein